jgi:hypothetical protein
VRAGYLQDHQTRYLEQERQRQSFTTGHPVQSASWRSDQSSVSASAARRSLTCTTELCCDQERVGSRWAAARERRKSVILDAFTGRFDVLAGSIYTLVSSGISHLAAAAMPASPLLHSSEKYGYAGHGQPPSGGGGMTKGRRTGLKSRTFQLLTLRFGWVVIVIWFEVGEVRRSFPLRSLCPGYGDCASAYTVRTCSVDGGRNRRTPCRLRMPTMQSMLAHPGISEAPTPIVNAGRRYSALRQRLTNQFFHSLSSCKFPDTP